MLVKHTILSSFPISSLLFLCAQTLAVEAGKVELVSSSMGRRKRGYQQWVASEELHMAFWLPRPSLWRGVRGDKRRQRR